MPDRDPDTSRGPTPGPGAASGSGPAPDAEAGPTPDPTEATDGVERLRDALTHPHRSQLVVGVLLAVLGFAFAVQVRDYSRDDPNVGLRQDELIRVFDGLTGTAERARREIESLEATRDDLRSDNLARETALTALEQRAQDLSILAGLVAVEGPGVRVTITESDGRVSVGSLLDTVQELRTADAEAMELNDAHRLTAQSSFQDAVGGIELDDELLEPPYVLEAIGDPVALEGAMAFATGSLKLDGATVRIERLDRVEIGSLAESPRPVHAEPAEPQ